MVMDFQPLYHKTKEVMEFEMTPHSATQGVLSYPDVGMPCTTDQRGACSAICNSLAECVHNVKEERK